MVVGLYPIGKGIKQQALSDILEETRLAVQAQGLKVIGFATDGGAPERSAQKVLLHKHERVAEQKHHQSSQSEVQTKTQRPVFGPALPPHMISPTTSPVASPSCLVVAVPRFGIRLTAPYIDGHPLIMIQDPEHARKTLRNNLRSGAGLLDLGTAVIAYETLLKMMDFPDHGLGKSDLIGGDKQDDGAALRLFHSQALKSLVDENGNLRPDTHGLFSVLFVFGQLPYNHVSMSSC